jgi:hypothetical protein
MEDNSTPKAKKAKKIDDVAKEFALDMNKAYEAQYKTIVMLQKQVNKLQEENEHLKKLLEENVQVINLDPTGLDPETIIAETQLQRLKDLSLRQPLTLEETKKVEIFQKIIMNNKGRLFKTPEEDASTMSNDELLKAFIDETKKQ